MTYMVFKRAARNFEEFATARKTTVRRGLTLAEAREFCNRENANRSDAQRRAGMKYEFIQE
jgi:predicted transcriptional regulator